MIQRTVIEEDQITFDEFCRRIPEDTKADLIDGAIYLASPETRWSNNLTGFLFHLLDGFLAARDLPGEIFVSRYAFKLSETNAPEPDVAYVGSDRIHLIQEGHMEGGPDIAIEIVSRDSRRRDNIDKRELYQAAGVNEYWIIDPPKRRAEFLHLTKGRYQAMPLEDNRIFRSGVIPGFWLDVEWLFAKPVPRAYRCLQELLAEKPRKPRKRSRKE